MELLAERIKQARQSKNLSQKQLASNIGVSGSAISQYESNSYFHSEPSIKKLIAISKALNVSIEWLATGRGNQNIKDFLKNDCPPPPWLFTNTWEETPIIIVWQTSRWLERESVVSFKGDYQSTRKITVKISQIMQMTYQTTQKL